MPTTLPVLVCLQGLFTETRSTFLLLGPYYTPDFSAANDARPTSVEGTMIVFSHLRLEFVEELRPGTEDGCLIICCVAGPIPCGTKDPAGFYFHLKALKQAGLWGERPNRQWQSHTRLG